MALECRRVLPVGQPGRVFWAAVPGHERLRRAGRRGSPPHQTQSDRLSVYGDDLMIQGRKLRDQGLASGDRDMQYRGEAMIARGRILIEKSNAMVDQPEPSGPVPGITHSPY